MPYSLSESKPYSLNEWMCYHDATCLADMILHGCFFPIFPQENFSFGKNAVIERQEKSTGKQIGINAYDMTNTTQTNLIFAEAETQLFVLQLHGTTAQRQHLKGFGNVEYTVWLKNRIVGYRYIGNFPVVDDGICKDKT